MSVPFRVLEFYSGIGGMRYAFESALGKDRGEFIKAFDINEIANEVYRHNFNESPSTINLDTIKANKLNEYKGEMYLMSPPCQPYTRVGNQKHQEDSRSRSFLNFLDGLQILKASLKFFLIENVAGFERSETRLMLIEKCKENGYNFQEFLINPLHLGIPNSRLRYYFIAKRADLGDFSIDSLAGYIYYSDLSNSYPLIEKKGDDSELESKYRLKFLNPCDKTDKELSYKVYKHIFKIDPMDGANRPTLQDYFDHDIKNPSLYEDYTVNQRMFEKYQNVYDIVLPTSNRTCCFTKGYTKFAHATGSILKYDENNPKFRYFTEMEIATLMGFPTKSNEDKALLNFPQHIGRKCRYKLLGNSLNVQVVAKLIAYMVE